MKLYRWGYQSEPVPGQPLWRAHPICQGLVAAYYFNGLSPTLINYATDETAPLNQWTFSDRIPSQFGYAYNFRPTSNNWVNQGTPLLQKSLTRNFTIQARVYLEDDTIIRSIYSQELGTTGSETVKSFVVNATDRRLRYYTSNDAFNRTFVESTLALSLNTWHTVAITVNKEATSATFYLDGQSQVVNFGFVVSNLPVTTVDCILFDTSGAFYASWDGPVDHLWMWDRALSREELRDLRDLPFLLSAPHAIANLPDVGAVPRETVGVWSPPATTRWKARGPAPAFTFWDVQPVNPGVLSDYVSDVANDNYGAEVTELSSW